MTIVNRLKPLLVLAILTALVGCRLQVISPAGGTVTWGGGGECLPGSVCEIAVTDANFTETFTATASAGYEFLGWQVVGQYRPTTPSANQPFSFPCVPSSTSGNDCTVSLSAYAPNVANAIVNTLSQGYLMPVYELLVVDTDGDGVLGDDDQCPNTPEGATVGAEGCPVVDSTDADEDGVLDPDDAYPNISLGGRLDTDGDGIPDDCDAVCQETGMIADEDDDGDGILDKNDAFPKDGTESVDTDRDSVGDNADRCVDTLQGTAVNSAGDLPGCRVVVIKEPIPVSAMASTQVYSRSFSIPGRGEVVAQPFTMPGDAGDADGDGVGRSIKSLGEFVFLDIVGEGYTPALRIWVSHAPGGDKISDFCELTNGVETSQLRFAAPIGVGIAWWCGLNPNQSYYLNVVHEPTPGTAETDPTQDPRSSNIKRKVKVAKLLDDDECPATPPNTQVLANGCSDADGDGVGDNEDVCPNTPPGTAVYFNGCPQG